MKQRQLSFKEYVASKKKLLEAIKETPIASLTYMVKRYCKMRVGETREKRYEVALKPNHTIIVEWRYDDVDNPEPISIVFDDISTDEHEVYWTGKKLTDWLSKNTIEEIL